MIKQGDISADSEPGEKAKKMTQHSLDDSSRHQILSLPSQFIEFMPSSQMETSLEISSISIAQLFRISLKKKKFNIIQDTSCLVTAMLKPKFSFRKLFRCCIEDSDSNFQTTIRLHLSINEKTCKRVITIKGLCGNPFPITKVIQDFTERVSKMSNTQQNGNYHHLQEEEEENFMTCKNETISYYQFCKVLSSDSYTLGRTISEFISSFNSQYRNPEQSIGLLPQPIESIKTKVEQTVQTLFSDYNYGRSSAERIMVYCRPAVEKYLFSKVIGTLLSIYIEKYKDSDREIERKQGEDEQISKLELGELSKYQYLQSVQQLNKLNSLLSPIEKLNSLISVISDAKSSVLQGSEGQMELNHQLEPHVVALVILQSQIQHPMAELMLLRDWQENFDQDVLEVFQEALNLILSFQKLQIQVDHERVKLKILNQVKVEMLKVNKKKKEIRQI